MNDDDLQILESYLDGEMSPAQSEVLWRRLSSEVELSAELEKLRAEHMMRQGIWASLEPAEHAVAQLEYSIVRGAKRQEILSTVSRGFGILTTAAACILMGFTIGWLGRDRYNPAAGVGAGDNGIGNNVSIVSHDPSINTPYVVYIRDGSGHVAQQNFSSEAEAESFARDVENAQANRRDNSQPMVVPTDVKFWLIASMNGRKTIFQLMAGGAFIGALCLCLCSNDVSEVFAQDAIRPQVDPSSTPRPLFQELNKESQSLFRDVSGTVVRVQLPLSESAMVDDPLQKWALRLDPEVRKEIDEIERRAPQNSISRVDVQPATVPSDGDPAHGGRHIIMLQVGQFTPNGIGVVFDDQQHLLIPQFVEKDSFDGPVTVQFADGRLGSAQFVASDRLADLTILQLSDLKGKAAVVSADQPENGALLLVMSLNNAFNRLAVWEGWEPDYAAIITIDSRIAGFTKGGRFISAATFGNAAQQLIDHGMIHRAVLGVTIRMIGPDDPQRTVDPVLGQTPALRVTDVRQGTAADRGGLHVGDLILKLAGKIVGDGQSFAAAIADLRGKTELTVLRDGRLMTVTVDLQVQ